MKHLYSTLVILFVSMYSFAQFGEWIERADLPDGRHHPVTFSLDGLGYAVTGSNQAQTPTSSMYRYDPSSDSWETMNAFPGVARSFAIGQAYNGKGYLGFGRSLTNYLADIWEYDPVEDEWNIITACPCEGRRHPAFLIHDDKIFVGLGDGPSGNLGDWWMYDMVEDEWTQMPNIPGPGRHHPFMFVANGELYAGMGHAGIVIYDDWYRFDQTTLTWEVMDDFDGEARVAGTQFSHANDGYVLSGDGSDHSYMETGEFWVYHDSNDTWEELTPHPGISRWALGSFVIEDTLFFLGGQNRQTGIVTSTMHSFQLVPDPVDTVPPLGISSVEAPTLRVFPNPTTDRINIMSNARISSVSILDMQGRIVLEAGMTEGFLDLQSIPSGMYVLQARTSLGTVVERFVKR